MKIQKKTLETLKDLYRKEQGESLLKQASQIQVQKPNSIIGRVFTARGLTLSRQYQAACDLLESIILPYPRLKKIYLEYLDTLQKGKMYSVWEIQAARFLSFHESARVCFQLGKHFYRNKEWRKSLNYFQKLTFQISTQDKLLLRRLDGTFGVLYYQVGDFAKAMKHLNQSDSPQSNYYRAKIYHDQGQGSRALLELQALKNFTKSKRSLQLARKICKESGDARAEYEVLSHLIKLVSDRTRKWQFLERMEKLARGLKDEALQLSAIQAMRKLGAKNSLVLEKEADLLYKKGSTARSCKIYFQLFEEGDLSEEGHGRLAEFFLSKKKLKSAIQVYKSAFYLFPEAFDLRLKYAELLLSCDQFSVAKELLQELLRDGKNQGRIYYLLSRIYRYEGREQVAEYYQGLFEDWKNRGAA